jgi:prolyl-tRNA synthetase
MPPRLAPYQTVIVPIYKENEETAVLASVSRIRRELEAASIRVKVDNRPNLTPGYKFNDWELRGVPIRIEIGPRDIANNSVAIARRDVTGHQGKQFISQAGLADKIKALLEDIHHSLLARATQFRDENTHDVANYEEFKRVIANGFARVWWAGSNEDEARVKEETKATLRCFLLDQTGGSGVCFYTGQPTTHSAIFGRAY